VKRLLILAVLLAASASAQYYMLGVVETGDYTVTIDTTTFFWGVRPDAFFVPWNWGGGPGKTDTFRFDFLDTVSLMHVWLDYTRNGTPMPRETIRAAISDHWYELPQPGKSPTRVRFIAHPGIEERSTPDPRRWMPEAQPNPFRTFTTISFFRPSLLPPPSSLSVYDASGRLVRFLSVPQPLAPGPYSLAWDGRDASGRAVPAGVYICRVGPDPRSPSLRLVKLS
jgi:hypothetical protein